MYHYPEDNEKRETKAHLLEQAFFVLLSLQKQCVCLEEKIINDVLYDVLVRRRRVFCARNVERAMYDQSITMYQQDRTGGVARGFPPLLWRCIVYGGQVRSMLSAGPSLRRIPWRLGGFRSCDGGDVSSNSDPRSGIKRDASTLFCAVQFAEPQ